MSKIHKIGLGGGCHWCTEAVFQSLIGVKEVEQGYISAKAENHEFSEAVIVHFDPDVISLDKLIEIHFYTHSSTSSHNLRKKYRSAIYTFSSLQYKAASEILKNMQEVFGHQLITEVLVFANFKASREQIQNYYRKDPERPFCKRFIQPKLKLLKKQFSADSKD